MEESDFECSVCLGIFEPPIRITHCGHVFCEECLLGTPESDLRWHCPTCRQVHNCPVNSLTRNYRFEKLVEKFKKEQAKPKPSNPFETCEEHHFPKSIHCLAHGLNICRDLQFEKRSGEKMQDITKPKTVMKDDFGSVDSPAIMYQGPLLVWNGDGRIAQVTNNAGVWPHGDKGGEVCNMFDGKPNTFWHSSKSTTQLPKTIKIEFIKPINFAMLHIRKRQDGSEHGWTRRYFNVCLVLNGQTTDEMCTNTPDGFNHDHSPFITWCKPTKNVTTVELIFRDKDVAQIADLKIFYQPE